MTKSDFIIAIAGNPNVGKSTVFNSLTGLNQHTGNWAGKTVSNAQGFCKSKNNSYMLVDIPGTYSLMAHSKEEEVAREFICFGGSDAVVVVCDATCIERNLNLVLQTMEICENVIVCVNLMDEARKKSINIDLKLLSDKLGVPVVGSVARKKKSLNELLTAMDNTVEKSTPHNFKLKYTKEVETAISIVEKALENKVSFNTRWLALKLLDDDKKLNEDIEQYVNINISSNIEIQTALKSAKEYLESKNIDNKKLKDLVVASIVLTAEDICNDVVTYENKNYSKKDRTLDKILTSKLTGYPIMFLLLIGIFWITITGANVPSQIIADGLFWFQDRLTEYFAYINAPSWLHGILVLGVYRVLAWVVSVMLPPMAIFFPLFTLLEDFGYLPRVAYNLDKPFRKCDACGKQALTMCMGFGCNAVGVIGCRIIDSPRERLLAMLTNVFVPCNGRFPTLIAILTMFFVVGSSNSLYSSLLLSLVILFGIAITFLMTKILSKTILKGETSSFTIELPPYRRPQFVKVAVRSLLDRTLFVLGRAVVVAAPVGLVIWILGNIFIGDMSILSIISNFLDPFAKFMGLDGVILLAFILGFPANEIVIPIIIMIYMAQGTILELDNISEMYKLFTENGWTWITAISTMIFSLAHWPCSTTLLTIKKESGSAKWTLLAALLPTAVGIVICIAFANIAKFFC